MISSTC